MRKRHSRPRDRRPLRVGWGLGRTAWGLLAEGLEAWDVKDIWLGWTNEPNHVEDITGYLDVKLTALARHRSQVEGDGIRFFEEWLPREAEEAGKKIGVQHAEEFRVLDLS